MSLSIINSYNNYTLRILSRIENQVMFEGCNLKIMSSINGRYFDMNDGMSNFHQLYFSMLVILI